MAFIESATFVNLNIPPDRRQESLCPSGKADTDNRRADIPVCSWKVLERVREESTTKTYGKV